MQSEWQISIYPSKIWGRDDRLAVDFEPSNPNPMQIEIPFKIWILVLLVRLPWINLQMNKITLKY